ncbi:E3 ubiquitin/ISG15 ligase TRIM25-like protein [Aphelenchoides avenae]|nr:E3 ubiquitin/ISG15 ligase TRIM25-like protein [Aphelenchus avenae]
MTSSGVPSLFHVSDANGFLCANCGTLMNPPRVLSCGHSMCHQCSQGRWGDAARLMREVHCRPCKKTEPKPGFMEPPVNRALQVALWKSMDFKNVVEGQLEALHTQVHDLQSDLARAEMEMRRKTQENAALQAELMALRCKVPPPPLPPRFVLPPPPLPPRLPVTPPAMELQDPLRVFQSQLRLLAEINGLLPSQ